jgi:Tol biopolymer transport system component
MRTGVRSRVAAGLAFLAMLALAAPASGLNGKIAFESRRAGQLDIWVTNADGSNPVNLTADLATLAFSPTFSPDGRRIAFETGGRLAVMDADGTNRVVSTIPMNSIGNPVFTPDGGSIVYETADSPQRLAIVSADFAGTPVVLQTGQTPTSQELSPTLSPDGNQLAWTSNRGPTVQVFLGAGNGSGGVVFRPGAPRQASPEFLPDGSGLAWVEETPGSPSIRMAPLSPIGGSATTIPAAGISLFTSLSVSPDGDRIAYSSTSQGGDQDVLVSRLDGSELTNLSDGATSNLVIDRSPAWAVAVDVPRSVSAAYKKRKKRFTGTLTSAGDPGCVPGAPILIERSKRGKLKRAATGTTDASGTYSIKLKRAKAGKYFVSSPADPREGVANCLPAAPVKIKVKGKKR